MRCRAGDCVLQGRLSLRRNKIMPLTITEVLETLEDPVALGIDFYADKIHVKGEDLSRVHERIVVGDILVTGGTSDLAFYDHATDILITQKKSPPADDGDRALLTSRMRSRHDRYHRP